MNIVTLLSVLEQIDDVYEYENFVEAARLNANFRKLFSKKMYEEYRSKLVETKKISYVSSSDRLFVIDFAKKGAKRGVKNGKIERYWRNVQTGELKLQMKGQYMDNVPCGDWVFYNKEGDVIQVFNRTNGRHNIDLVGRQIELALYLNEVEIASRLNAVANEA